MTDNSAAAVDSPNGNLSLAAAFAAWRFPEDASAVGAYSPSQLSEGTSDRLIASPAPGFNPVLDTADNIFHRSHVRHLHLTAASSTALSVETILSYYGHG
jgi:hypothetical protein